MAGGIPKALGTTSWIYLTVGIASSILVFHQLLNYIKSAKKTTIPGPPPSHPQLGNLADISKAGSFHQYLSSLQKLYGTIVSFWFGPDLTVSIASPELFKQAAKLFNRPGHLFADLELLLTKHSILYTNGEEGRLRHALYSLFYSVGASENYFDLFHEIADELVLKWMCASSDMRDIEVDMFLVAIKAISRASFGPFFNNEDEITAYCQHHTIMWNEHELQAINGGPPPPGGEREKQYKDSIAAMQDIVRRAIEFRQKSPWTGNPLLIDVIMEHAENEDVLLADAMTFLWIGFYTSAMFMTWSLYFLAKHPEYQEKVYQELCDVLGDGPIDNDNIQELFYTRQVLDETLRCSSQYTISSRFCEVDLTLDDHRLPAKTALIYALGVLDEDEELWPDPTRFHPDRFSAEKRCQIPSFAFEPFGFAGKRRCPGYKFTLIEVPTVLSVLLREFKMVLVEEHDKDITKHYSIVTRPKKKKVPTATLR